MKFLAAIAPLAGVLALGPGAQGAVILRGAGGQPPRASQESAAEKSVDSIPSRWHAVLARATRAAMSAYGLSQVTTILSRVGVPLPTLEELDDNGARAHDAELESSPEDKYDPRNHETPWSRPHEKDAPAPENNAAPDSAGPSAHASPDSAGPSAHGSVSHDPSAHTVPVVVNATSSEHERWERQEREVEMAVGSSWLLSLLIWLAFGSLAGKYWLNNSRRFNYYGPPGSTLDEHHFSDFRAGICGWYQRPDVSCWVWFCPAVRWAENMWTMGLFRSFWFAFVFFGVVYFIGFSTQEQDGSMGWLERLILLGVVGAGFRQELREKFQMANRGRMTYVQDCLLYACCTCCTVVQEARMIEDAVRKGHPAVVHKADAVRAPAQEHVH